MRILQSEKGAQMPWHKLHFEINTQDISKLHKKYFIHKKKSFLGKKAERVKWKASTYFSGTKKRILSVKKFNRLPKKFLLVFDQNSYLLANEDVRRSLESGKFDTPLEHFMLFGYDEVRAGQRRIGSEFPLFTEKEYAKAHPDVAWGIDEGKFSSAFEHFLLFGYEEFISGERELPGTYFFEWSNALKSHVKSYFDEEAYLQANTDVVAAMEKEEFESGWDHFLLRGLDEIRRGERTLHSSIPKLSERVYALNNPDIFDAQKYAESNSPFEHFLRYGVREIIAGERIVQGLGIYKYIEPRLIKIIAHKLENFTHKPLISVIIPVYNVEMKWLEMAIDSLKGQWYSHWELCIADDASTNSETVNFLKALNDPKIKVKFLEENVNISAASNAALGLASGDYIALMDHDDELTVDALYEVVRSINKSGAEFIYSDEDKIEPDGRFTDPHFKSDFSPDMFLSQNYISHFAVIKKTLIEQAEGWTPGLEGSQDYDLYLKVLEKTDKIIHIPKVLYHWRKVPGSTAAEFSEKSYAQQAGRQALENAMKRRNINAEVLNAEYPGTYRVKYTIHPASSIQHSTSETKLPLVSIVIPFRDKPELLDMCINSVLDCSNYPNYEIIALSNNSEENATFEMMKLLQLKDERVHFYEYNEPFNYSAVNNYAVKNYAKGEQIILLNNDIEIITPDWIESLLEFSQRDDVGMVGAKLYYPDNSIQHAGVVIGVLGLAGHNFRHLPKDQAGYMARASVIQNASAVTTACAMIKRDLYLSMNGMNEKDLKIAFNDIDLCLRIREAGYLNIYTPYCEAYHYESISRGLEDSPEKLVRFNKEISYMKSRHDGILEKGDPYYNPNLTLENEDFGVV